MLSIVEERIKKLTADMAVIYAMMEKLHPSENEADKPIFNFLCDEHDEKDTRRMFLYRMVGDKDDSDKLFMRRLNNEAKRLALDPKKAKSEPSDEEETKIFLAEAHTMLDWMIGY